MSTEKLVERIAEVLAQRIHDYDGSFAWNHDVARDILDIVAEGQEEPVAWRYRYRHELNIGSYMGWRWTDDPTVVNRLPLDSWEVVPITRSVMEGEHEPWREPCQFS